MPSKLSCLPTVSAVGRSKPCKASDGKGARLTKDKRTASEDVQKLEP